MKRFFTKVCKTQVKIKYIKKRPHFVTSIAKEILAQMSNAKFFTKLYPSNAYYQIPVDDERTKLPTVNLPNDLYRFYLCQMAFTQQVMFAKIEHPKC